MIKSMTGYGRAKEPIGKHVATIEVRSVNNRHLDCSIKLPRLYGFAEDALKAKVRERISRGKVDVYITIDSSDADNVAISLNRSVAAGYITAMRSAAREFGIADDITVSGLSRLPDVFSLTKQEEDADAFTDGLCAVLEKALYEFDRMRQTEGNSLEADIRSRMETIRSITAEIEARSPATVSDYRQRLEQKIKELLGNTDIDEIRVLTETAIFADRIAVDEEVVRIKSHLDQMKAMLDAGGIIGRKLDFLLQELNREANTIGSKGNDTQQAMRVVDLKAELEKIREQAQNIE